MNILIKTKNGVICPECHDNNIKYDFKRCEAYCSKCGLVCMDTNINCGYLDYFRTEFERIMEFNLNHSK